MQSAYLTCLVPCQEDVAARDLDDDWEFTEKADRHEASFNFRFEVDVLGVQLLCSSTPPSPWPQGRTASEDENF